MQLPLWNEKRYAPYKVAALVDVLNEQGIAPEASLSGTGLSPDSLAQPQTLTSIRQYITVCNNSLQLSKDPETPFRVGSRIPLSAYGMYGFALVCSPTIREYFQVAIKYHRLATPLLFMSWREEKDCVAWVLAMNPAIIHPDSLVRFLLEQQLTQIATHLRTVVEHGRCQPISASLPYPAPRHVNLYKRYLGCKLLFDAPVSELSYPRSILSEKPHMAHGLTSKLMQDTCDRILGEVKTSTGVAGEVYQIIASTPGHSLTMETAARRLATTVRTLHRKLQAEGTTSALYFLQEEYAITDTLSWIKGKHQFTFGGGLTYGRDNMGKFDFEAYVIPLTWADLLLGQANIYGTGWSNIYETYEGIGDFVRDWRYKDANGFVQDDYRIAKRLTLNLGLRYEHIGALGSANGGGNVDTSALNPNPPSTGSVDGYLVNSNYSGAALPTGVIEGSNTFGFNGDGQNTWNPRLGFALALPRSDRFVLRGGVGVYHTTTEGQMNLLMCAEAPTGIWSVLTGTNNGNSSDANPFPAAPDFPVFTPYSPSTDFTMAALAMDWRPPTTYHYSLGLQSKLPGGALLDVAYAGARDLHTILGRTMNQASLASAANPINGQTTNTQANVVDRKPYQGWTPDSMYIFKTGGEAWYSALQASLSQKFRHSFQYQAAYTWERLLTPVPGFTVGSNEFGPTGDQNNLRAHNAGYGPDYNVRPQRFVLSAYYALPNPANSHRLLANTLGGWSVATATVIQDGQQGSIGYSNTDSVYGISSDRASYASGCTAKNVSTSGSVSHRVNNYINKSCFTAPAAFGDDGSLGFGNTPNGILRGPDQADVDFSLSKNQQVHWPKEGSSAQLRADFFNALNHPNFSGPNSTYGTSTFGQISSMSTNPRVIQLALRFSF
jgi:hypothetical protein